MAVAEQSTAACEHLVHFYERDSALVQSIATFAGTGLATGAACLVIATESRLRQLHEHWKAAGIDISAARARDQYVCLDATDALSRVMSDGRPNESLFEQFIGHMVATASDRYSQVRAYCEMSSLLWQEGDHSAAIELEELWNGLRCPRSVSVLCAYPLPGVDQGDTQAVTSICSVHSRIVPEDGQMPRVPAEGATEVRSSHVVGNRDTPAPQLHDDDLKEFLDQCAEGLQRVGPDGRIEWANRTLLELLGYSASEYIGRHLSEFWIDPNSATQCLVRLSAGEKLDGISPGLRHKDGAEKVFTIRAVGRFENGKLLHSRWFIRDATAEKHTQQLLIETGRRQEEFLATLAHELRNPLAPIRNAVQIMRVAEGDQATVAAARTMIERQLKHMVRLIDDLMDVSRVTRGKLELRKQRVELAAVVQIAIETSRPLLEAKHHQLRVELPDEPLHVEADTTRLSQVFSNLLNNSAKYTEPGGVVTIRAARQGRRAVVTVRDTGIGIEPAMLPRVFEMFSQVRRPNGIQEGLGIGLSLVRRLVELHGGRVEAASEGLGKGSTFTVELNLVDACVKPADCSLTLPRASESVHARILVADDNRDAAYSLALMLSLDGHEVRTAGDGMEALEIAEEFHPHVILLDLGMPRLDGYEAARRLRQRPWAASTLVLAQTGWGQAEDRQRSTQAGFHQHLVKPVDPELLKELLSQRLRHLAQA